MNPDPALRGEATRPLAAAVASNPAPLDPAPMNAALVNAATLDAAGAFLAALPVFSDFGEVADPRHYLPLPEGWMLALADVVSSGEAVAAGRYKMVNMAGAAVITAVLNALGRADAPFVFGGDGAVVAVPGEAAAQVAAALGRVARWIEEDLDLRMRVALVPVAAPRAEGLDVQVARFATSADLSFAMFAGGGSAWAEAQMKAGRFAVAAAPPGARPDLDGLSCRWSPFAARNGQIVSVIAVPVAGGDPDAFARLVADVAGIAARYEGTGNPLPREGPRPAIRLRGLGAEIRARAPPGRRLGAALRVAGELALTVVSHRTGLAWGRFDARAYTAQMVANTDFRKFDDGLKMTIDVDEAGRADIAGLLEAAERAGVATFGMHAQDSALVTCIVPSAVRRDHIHFIDGGTGGYAQAALRMKEKRAGGGPAIPA